ncbi:magnesium-transporting ATPase (P-type) [Evansella vedderi]|uniref:Magnesium-transporting ATPase (P-type) n=1 Tax=Evansella vedderi TaxID=38282 RepID=A0ABT9ZW18_9BACI|nr:YwiC-like family protein [Evansella vedderi]MDQ0255424.1 magnesium-transporting ATPase (P-type) [Evansella vedderi]
MKWYIPREHGAWAMLIVPYWIGASISGVQWSHLLFFIGLFALYFAQAPLLTYIRNPKNKDVWPSFFAYISIGSIIIIPFFLTNFSLLWISLSILPLFMINLVFAKLKKERWFINDLIAIIALSSLLLLAYRLTEPAIHFEAYKYVLLNVLFFTGSVFHVKSLIREKNNKMFQRTSIFYHIMVVIFTAVLQLFGAALTFLLSLLKTLYVPKSYLKRPLQIGVVEIINSVLFFLLVIYW